VNNVSKNLGKKLCAKKSLLNADGVFLIKKGPFKGIILDSRKEYQQESAKIFFDLFNTSNANL
jgi:hypothetical protein